MSDTSAEEADEAIDHSGSDLYFAKTVKDGEEVSGGDERRSLPR
jgi:hypothetical protein